ncbi:hypothetical protein HSBGL_1890 [Halapricum desulfuricans]|uniref:Uncharacterized protein n=1 Tax=Halapricum desulfuricans TaxID=2841257 RepID=A0A897NJ04_9EURY|nr:hypothetical protein HSBGL_1890 [Halapricum desulfuricans]
MDDARLGTNDMQDASDAETVGTERHEIGEPETTARTPNVRRLVVASLVVSVVVSAIARRLFADDKPTASIEIDESDAELDVDA